MPGFDTNDPSKNSQVGYRSRVLLDNGPVSYNGFTFPPALRSSVTVVPEYSEAETTLRYLTVALQIEFIFTDPTIPVHQIGDPSKEAENRDSIALMMPTIIKRLTTPGQALEFKAQGFGNFTVNAGTVFDVDYGPKPQVVEYEPLGGGNAARIQWLCTTRISPCPNATYNISEYSYEMDWTLDEGGFMIRTIDGSAKIAQSRSPRAGDTAPDNVYSLKVWRVLKKLKEAHAKEFPLSPHFNRKYSYKVSRNKAKIDFKIEDVELKTDEMYFPGAVNMNVSKTVSSDLENGFAKWAIMLSGSISVANAKKAGFGINYSKVICWLYLAKIIRQLKKNFESIIKEQVPTKYRKEIVDNTSDSPIRYPPGSDALKEKDEYATYSTSVIIQPVSVSITDELYSNSISFNFGFTATISSDLIMYAVGMFQPLDIEGLDRQTWVKYLENSGTFDETLDPSIRDQGIIVDLCNDLQSLQVTENTKQVKSPYYDDSHSVEGLLELPENGEWKLFRNTFEFYANSGNQIAAPLVDTDMFQTDYININPDAVKPEDEPPLDVGKLWQQVSASETENNPQSQSKYQTKLTILKNSPDVCYVRMTGMAQRYGKKPIIPKLLGIGKGIRYNVSTGLPEFSDEQKNADAGQGAGTNTRNGALAYQFKKSSKRDIMRMNGLRYANSNKTVILHLVSWDYWYVLDRVPGSGEIVTTGNPLKVQ